ncbi:MAG: hypothetical protein LUC43_04030 [Burkholderiales bacterium]|nr:hypothetical protein [Burkholderiales bacterium]
MIKESLKVQGSKQFEVKQRVSIPKGVPEFSYEVTTYFFLPSALQINSHTFKAGEFGRSIKNYIRLQAPVEKISRMTKPQGALSVLKKKFERIYSTTEEDKVADFESECKLFALVYKSALRKLVKRYMREVDVTRRDAEALSSGIRKVLNGFRDLKPLATDIQNKYNSKAFNYCDEYMTVITNFYLKKLYTKYLDEDTTSIENLWQEQTEYLHNNYPTEIPPRENEQSAFLFRWAAIKKYVGSLLFLDVRYRSGPPVLQHTLYGIAAALSMIFATLIAFLFQDRYGSISVNLFIALVIGYIFKDRIQEISREWFSSVFSEWLPDRRLRIYKDTNKKVGKCEESFDFVRLERLSPILLRMEAKAHVVSLVNDRHKDTVFRYKKKVTIKQPQLMCQMSGNALLDIVRFNIADFIKNIDSNFEDLPFFVGEDQDSTGEKIYHIHMIRVMAVGQQRDLEITRIAVNAEGIKYVYIVKPFRNTVANIEEDFTG